MGSEVKANAGVDTGAQCPECGTWHAAAALCPHCALSLALHDDEGAAGNPEPEETQEGDPSPAAALPADFAHFTLERDDHGAPVELGRGGMGVTYLATDRALRTKVALKVISPARVGDRAAQALFLREARAAARVRHTNVASVHYLSEPPGNVFYAMEFVPGEPLRRWIERHAPVPPLLALALAEQIARGLGAIHHEGIVHRDLKPGNVMLVPAPRSSAAGPLDPLSSDAWHVKIIDFGLARAVAKDDEFVSTIGFRGTALYASPEQCEERHDLDGRADLYSLGCILFELLTGGPPFKARTHRELMNLHVSTAPPLERLEHLPASLTAIVARLLVKNPEDRFADAESLVKALVWARSRIECGEGTAQPTNSALPTPRVTPRLFPAKAMTPAAPTPELSRLSHSKPCRVVRTRPRWLLSAAAVILASVAVIWQLDFRAPATDRLSLREVGHLPIALAVLPFASLSADKENGFLTEGLHAEILTSLARLRNLKVISRLSVERYAPGAGRDLRKIGAELGVGSVLSGSVQCEGDRIRVKLELVNVATNQALWVTSLDRTPTSLLSVQNEVALEVGERLLSQLGASEKSALMRPVANSATAYQHFLRARGLMGGITMLRKDLDEAATALEAALEADASYALAHAQLALLHMIYYAWGRDQTDQRLSLAWNHADIAAKLQPDLPEASLAFGTYYYRGFRDYERAVPYFRRVLDAVPGNPDALMASAYIERRKGRWIEATTKLVRAFEASPFDAVLGFNVANTLLYQRRYEEAERLANSALARSPNHPALTKIRGEIALAARGDLQPMRDDIVLRAPDKPTLEFFVWDQVQLLCFERKFDSALRALRESRFEILEGELGYVTRPMMEAEILTQAGRVTEAREAWGIALPRIQELSRQRPQDVRLRLAYALALAGVGDSIPAQEEARAASEMLPIDRDALLGPIVDYSRAIVLRRTGDNAGAEALRRKILQAPSPYSENFFRVSPEWSSPMASLSP